jgi:hypothetical protein
MKKTELQKEGEMVLDIIGKMSRKPFQLDEKLRASADKVKKVFEREEKHLSTKELYEKAVHAYCELFCEIMWDNSTAYDTDYWVAGDIGTIICIADYWFSFLDIKEVVDKGIDKDTVFEWYDYTMEGGRINLYHYAKGLREEKENI